MCGRPVAGSRTIDCRPTADGLQVYLLTFGEGELYWEKYGHNALWFRDTTRMIDAAYNWGTFNFTEPGFLRRLLVGNMQYWVEAYPGRDLITAYERLDRTVVVQRLNLTPAQAQKAYDFAVWNARDENKYYRYDYFRDNCSTRVRDVIDLAVGGGLKTATANTVVPRSYRSETLRLVDDLKLTEFGIDVALGKPADKPLSVWESAFVPSRLRDAVRDVRVPGDGGVQVPLMADERVLYESRMHAERADAPRLSLAYLGIGLLLASVLVFTGHAGRRSPAVDTLFRVETTVWALLTGLLGVIVLLAWLITDHVFWFFNRNLLLVNPLALFVAILVLPAIWRPRFARAAAICAVIVAMLSALALIVFAVPALRQDNLPLILLMLPPNFAIAYELWRRAPAESREPRAESRA